MSAGKLSTKMMRDSSFDEQKEDDMLNRRLKQKIVIGDKLHRKFDQMADSGKFMTGIDKQRDELRAKRDQKVEQSRRAREQEQRGQKAAEQKALEIQAKVKVDDAIKEEESQGMSDSSQSISIGSSYNGKGSFKNSNDASPTKKSASSRKFEMDSDASSPRKSGSVGSDFKNKWRHDEDSRSLEHKKSNLVVEPVVEEQSDCSFSSQSFSHSNSKKSCNSNVFKLSTGNSFDGPVKALDSAKKAAQLRNEKDKAKGLHQDLSSGVQKLDFNPNKARREGTKMGGLSSKHFGSIPKREGTRMFGGPQKREGTKMFGSIPKREGTKMFGGGGFSNNLTQKLLMNAGSRASGAGSSRLSDGSSISLSKMSMLELESAQAATVKVLLDQKVGEYKRSVTKAHEVDLKNTKHLAVSEAKEFVKFATNDIQDAFTKEIRTIVEQFINFKKRTWTEIDIMRNCETSMVIAEKLAVQQHPLYEQVHAYDPRNPLRAFDCLKPRLYEIKQKEVQEKKAEVHDNNADE